MNIKSHFLNEKKLTFLLCIIGIVIYSEDKSWNVGDLHRFEEINETIKIDPKTLPSIAQINILKYL